MNRCPDARALLPAYVENELSPVETMRVRGHLDLCSSCRREELSYRSALGALSGAPKPMHDDLYAGLSAKLARLDRQPAIRPLRPRQLRWAGGLACLALAVGVGATVAGRSLFKPNPPAQPETLVTSPPAAPKDRVVRGEPKQPAAAPVAPDRDSFEPTVLGTQDVNAPDQGADAVSRDGGALTPKPIEHERRRERARQNQDESWRAADFRDIRAKDGSSVRDIVDRLRSSQHAALSGVQPRSSDHAPDIDPPTIGGVDTVRDLPVKQVSNPSLPNVTVIVPEPEKRETVGERVVKSSRTEGFDKKGRLAFIRLNAESTPKIQDKSELRKDVTGGEN